MNAWGEPVGGAFRGDVDITCSLTKTGSAFRIDHPLDPANRYLSHSAVESPERKNRHDGVVTLDAQGAATVTLPVWFTALNRDLHYQLPPLEQPATGVHADLGARQSTSRGGGQGRGGTRPLPSPRGAWRAPGSRD